MKRAIRVTALFAAVALLSTGRTVPVLAAPRDAEGPCQLYCDAMYALCNLFGGGYLCQDMRDGCRFGCNIKVL